MTAAQLHEEFRRAAEYAVSTRVGKVRSAPMRTAATKVASLACRGLRKTLSLRGTTFWGDTMRVLLPEPVSEQLLACGLFEPGVTAYLLKLLRPGDVLFDVGAHFGYFSLLGARLTGKKGQVHAFEPMPETFGVLAENTADRGNVSLNQLAVWSKNSDLEIRDYGPRLSAFNSVYAPRVSSKSSRLETARTVTVQAVTLDHYRLATMAAPTFIKIDAESAEHEIVQGMHQLLTYDRPAISIEVGDFDLEGVPTSAELLSSIIEYGYQPFEFTEEIKPHELRQHYSYNNILLMPKESVSDSLFGPFLPDHIGRMELR